MANVIKIPSKYIYQKKLNEISENKITTVDVVANDISIKYETTQVADISKNIANSISKNINEKMSASENHSADISSYFVEDSPNYSQGAFAQKIEYYQLGGNAQLNFHKENAPKPSSEAQYITDFSCSYYAFPSNLKVVFDEYISLTSGYNSIEYVQFKISSGDVYYAIKIDSKGLYFYEAKSNEWQTVFSGSGWTDANYRTITFLPTESTLTGISVDFAYTLQAISNYTVVPRNFDGKKILIKSEKAGYNDYDYHVEFVNSNGDIIRVYTFLASLPSNLKILGWKQGCYAYHQVFFATQEISDIFRNFLISYTNEEIWEGNRNPSYIKPKIGFVSQYVYSALNNQYSDLEFEIPNVIDGKPIRDVLNYPDMEISSIYKLSRYKTEVQAIYNNGWSQNDAYTRQSIHATEIIDTTSDINAELLSSAIEAFEIQNSINPISRKESNISEGKSLNVSTVLPSQQNIDVVKISEVENGFKYSIKVLSSVMKTKGSIVLDDRDYSLTSADYENTDGYAYYLFDKSGILEVYELTQFRIKFNGNVLTLDIQDGNLTFGNDKTAKFSIAKNELIQTSNSINGENAIEKLSNSVIKSYLGGKETAVITCGIAKYYEEGNPENLLVDHIGANSLPMLIPQHSIVVPYIPAVGENGETIEKPMSTDILGKPKSFLVVSREISYDGSTRQILHLIENSVVSEIPDKPKISPPPTISLNGSQLSIIDNSGIAEEYVIIADGIEKQSVYSASVDLLSIGLFVGTHLISVKSRANGFTDSARSNEVTFIIKSSQYEKISFNIGEDIYFAEETMTWYDWCHSGYNTGGWIARANDQYNEIFRYVSSSKIETIVANGIPEKAINAIVANYAYSVKEGFVDNTDNSELLDYVDKNYASKKELADAKAELEQSIDDAIGDIDFSELATKKEVEQALTEYDKSTVVNQKITKLKEDVQKWVQEQDYTTDTEVGEKIRLALEGLVLDGYVTDAELEQALVDTLSSFGIEYIINADGSEELKLKGHATRTEMEGYVNAKLGEFTVEYTQKIDSLQFGGRNLYTNSSDFLGSKWVNLNLWAKDSNLDSYGNVIMYKIGTWGGIHQRINAKAGDVYTLSATVFGDGACWGHFYAAEYNSSGQEIYGVQVKNYEPSQLKSSGTRVYASYTVKNDCTLSFRIENSMADATIKISSLKLERGNKPTDWTAAPEDNDKKFADTMADINAEISDIKNQIDGVVDTWFGDEKPTLSNKPAVDWTTEADKEAHLGDTYYDNTTGYGYRWQVSNGTYLWVEISNSDAVKALALAAKAQDTADGKRRVFVDTPTPPYDVGDLWTVTTSSGVSGDLMRCAVAKKEGESYSSSDWVKATKYIDQEEANKTTTDRLNEMQIGGRNLAYYTADASSPIVHTGITVNSGGTALSHRWNLTKSTPNDGTTINANLFTVDETYTISYFFRKTSGTLKNIGGHNMAFNQLRFSLDGREISTDYYYSVTLDDNTDIHYVVYTAVYTGEDQIGFWVQPNRDLSDAVTYDLWNIKVEKGEKATDFTPAWEEYYTTVTTDAKIKETADSIRLSVSGLSDRLDRDFYTKAQIDVTAGAIRQEVSAIEVGGRNIISKELMGDAIKDIVSNDSFSGFGYICPSGTNTISVFGQSKPLGLKRNRDYTISFKAWSANTYSICWDLWVLPSVGDEGELPQAWFTTSTEPQLYTWTFKRDVGFIDKAELRFFNADSNGIAVNVTTPIYITDIKIEEGNKRTDWTPAVQDMASVDFVKGSLALEIKSENGKYYSELSSNVDRIDFKSGQITIQSNKFTLDKNGNATFGGTLNAATGSFSGNVTANYLNASTGGILSGWKFDSNSMQYGTLGQAKSMWLCTTGTQSTTANIAGSGTTNGWCIGVADKFGVTNTGAVWCSELHASGGDIGGVKIGSLAQKSEIPTKVSELNNDKNFATTGQLPTKTSQLTNDSDFKNTAGVKSVVNADYISTLELEVGKQIKMGANAIISWDNVDRKPDVATKSDVSTAQSNAVTNAVAEVNKKGYATTSQVSTAKSEAINAAAIDAKTKADNAKTAAVNDVKKLGYQTATQVTQITKNTVTTAYVNALGISVNAANITGTLTVNNSQGRKLFSAGDEQVFLAGFTVRHDANGNEYISTNGKQSHLDSTTNGVFIGKNGIGLGKKKFWVDAEGTLFANDATIEGKITAKEGYIGKLKIEGNNITAGDSKSGITIYSAFDSTNGYMGVTSARIGGWRFNPANNAGAIVSGGIDYSLGHDHLNEIAIGGNGISFTNAIPSNYVTSSTRWIDIINSANSVAKGVAGTKTISAGLYTLTFTNGILTKIG